MTMRRRWIPIVGAVVIGLACARQAGAQGFISPFIGYNFGGTSGCPEITNCQNKHANYGVAFGALGSIVGFESEIAKTNDFLGASSTTTTDVLTFMGNFMLAPKFGPVQPYGVAGVGLIRTSGRLLDVSADDNKFGYDLGGGLIVFFTRHVGVRGDVRYFKSFQVSDFLNVIDLPIDSRKINFGRASIAAEFKF